jgi:hypothetical protein
VRKFTVRNHQGWAYRKNERDSGRLRTALGEGFIKSGAPDADLEGGLGRREARGDQSEGSLQLFGIERFASWASAVCGRGGETVAGALGDEAPLEMCDRPEHVEDEFSGDGGGVDLLLERSRRALRPRSMIQRGLPSFPYGRSVRHAIAETRRHQYSHSCVEPSLWLRRRLHKPRPVFETRLRCCPSNGIDKATLAARLLGHCRREHARLLFWGQAYLSVADAYLFFEAQR